MLVPLTGVIAAHSTARTSPPTCARSSACSSVGFHDVVIGRVDDVGEYAAYLDEFLRRDGWQRR